MPHRIPSTSLLFLLAVSCLGRDGSDPLAEGPRAPERTRAAAAQPDPRQIAEYVVEGFEDSRGVLWFGTNGEGVARYDGQALTYLTERDGLCGNTIASIAEDQSGALWFAGHTGACRYDGAFTPFFDTETSVRTDRSGAVWVSTNDAVYRHDGTAFVAFDIPRPPERPTAYSIRAGRVSFRMEDGQGNLWFGTDGDGALRYDPSPTLAAAGRSFTRFTKREGLCSDTVWDILEDRRGRIWFACIQAYQPAPTQDGGVCRYDGKTFTTFPAVAGLSRNDVYTIHEDRSGGIWIGATGVGAYRYDGTRFTLFDRTDRPDLTTNFGLQALLEDRSGTLWCGFSGGLFRFTGSSFANVTRGGPWGPSPAGDG